MMGDIFSKMSPCLLVLEKCCVSCLINRNKKVQRSTIQFHAERLSE